MAHHRRGRAKNRRAGCLLCKPWKANGYGKNRRDRERFSDHRRRDAASREIQQAYTGATNVSASI